MYVWRFAFSCCFQLLMSFSYVLFLASEDVIVKDLLSEAWSDYWAVISRRSVQTVVLYVIMTLLLTACPAVCVYYSVRCTRLINSLHQYTCALDSETKVISALYGIRYITECTSLSFWCLWCALFMPCRSWYTADYRPVGLLQVSSVGIKRLLQMTKWDFLRHDRVYNAGATIRDFVASVTSKSTCRPGDILSPV